MTWVIPFFADAARATIVIDGVTYRPPLIDAAGHVQVDVVSSALPTLAATSTKQDTMITALQLIDDLRAALAAVGTDRLNVNAFATGASEVKAARFATAEPSTTRTTILTPTSGKAVRIVAVILAHRHATGALDQIYFGTGANIATDPTKAIMEAWLAAGDQCNVSGIWPDGAGPLGAVDDVVSVQTSVNINISLTGEIHYREE